MWPVKIAQPCLLPNAGYLAGTRDESSSLLAPAA